MKKIILISAVLSSAIYASGPVYKTGIIGYTFLDGDDGTYDSGLNAHFIQSNDGTVKDSYLNLLWQNNIGKDSIPNLSYTDALSYCNNLNLSNRSDWRLPTRLESKSIVQYFWGYPSVFEVFKERTITGSPDLTDPKEEDFINYWTATEQIDDSSKVWRISYYAGNDRAPAAKDQFNRVRCVSGNHNITASYSKKNGIVLDNDTGLMWQDDYNDNPETLNDTIESGTWVEAINYCNNLTTLNYNDWRLPNFNELYFITDDTQSNPAISSKFQQTDTTTAYWVSSLFQSKTSYAGVISFDIGADSIKEKTDIHNIRCVRGKVKSKINYLPSIMSYLLN